MLESKIQSKIIKFLKKDCGFPTTKLVASLDGWPDVITVINGITYYLEVKQPCENLKVLQKITIDKLNKDKQIAFKVESLDDVKKIIERILK